MGLEWDHSGAALTVSVDKKSDASARDGGVKCYVLQEMESIIFVFLG